MSSFKTKRGLSDLDKEHVRKMVNELLESPDLQIDFRLSVKDVTDEILRDDGVRHLERGVGRQITLTIPLGPREEW